jgi:hypothetical protein
MAKLRVGVEYSPSILEPVRTGAVSPIRALCLPTFSHFVIVNKTSLSLSLSHTHTHTHGQPRTLGKLALHPGKRKKRVSNLHNTNGGIGPPAAPQGDMEINNMYTEGVMGDSDGVCVWFECTSAYHTI